MNKFLSLAAALVLLSACGSTGNDSGMGSMDGTMNTPNGGSSLQGGMGVANPGTQEDMVVNVGDRVFFNFDQSNLTQEARATLDRQASWLRKYPSVAVTIEGHCDERGTREYNLALGERRAMAVKNYLVATGVSEDRLTTVSYGKERPAVLGSNEAAWAQNRRSVTIVMQ